MFNVTTVRANKSSEIITWQNRVIAAGGGFESNSLVIANNFLTVVHGKSYYSKLVYLLPMLGVGVGAARTPLIDKLNVGSATSTAFLDADFSQSTGLQGNGTTKNLNSLLTASQLGTSNNGGLGYWENNFTANGLGPLGSASTDSTNSYEIGLRNTLRTFRWGNTSNGATESVIPVNGHYYGQRSSAVLRQLFLNGSSIASNTTNDSTSGAGNRNIFIVGTNWPSPEVPCDNSRCALAYLTDGSMSNAEIGDFHSVLQNYLMIPTGKPQS